jgi:hypothetical protein
MSTRLLVIGFGSSLSVTLLLANCGGTAVIDDLSGTATGTAATGSGTGVGTSAGTTTGTPSGTGTGAGTGTPTDTHAFLCQEVCGLIDTCLVAADCVSRCQQSPNLCQWEHQDWLACLLDGTTAGRCDHPAECLDDLWEFQQCAVTGTGTGMCSGGGNSCQCQTDVNGSTYETYCDGMSGGTECRCAIDGNGIGSCSQPGPAMDGCDPYSGCCATLFFVPF